MAFNTGGALSGAGSGASIGFAVGGPVGAGIGAVGGGLLGAFGLGKRKRPKRVSTLDKRQQQLYNQQHAGLNGQGPLKDLYGFDTQAATDNFQKSFADPAYQQFQEGIVPSITGQFRGGNLQNSSYLGNALSKAGTDVQRNLNAHLSNLLYQGQQDALTRRVNGINNLLNTQTFNYAQPQENAGQQAFGALQDYGGKALGSIVDNKLSQQRGQQFTPPSPLTRQYAGSAISTPGGG